MAASDHGPGPFSRVSIQKGCLGFSSCGSFGRFWEPLPFLHRCLGSPGAQVFAHSCASDPPAGLSEGWALFCSFPDQEVRRMAVQWIGSLSDAELLDYLPQLVQVG